MYEAHGHVTYIRPFQQLIGLHYRLDADREASGASQPLDMFVGSLLVQELFMSDKSDPADHLLRRECTIIYYIKSASFMMLSRNPVQPFPLSSVLQNACYRDMECKD